MEYTRYKKRVYNLMGFFADLGGIFNALVFIGRFLIQISRENTVFAKIITSIFVVSRI
jgi:hypothetical protein